MDELYTDDHNPLIFIFKLDSFCKEHEISYDEVIMSAAALEAARSGQAPATVLASHSRSAPVNWSDDIRDAIQQIVISG